MYDVPLKTIKYLIYSLKQDISHKHPQNDVYDPYRGKWWESKGKLGSSKESGQKVHEWYF